MTARCSVSSFSQSPSALRAFLLFTIFLSGLLTGCSPGSDEQAVEKSTQTSTQQKNTQTTQPVDYSNITLTVQDISEREYGKSNALAITFSTPIQPDQNFQRTIQVSPALAEPVLSKDGRRLYYTNIEPGVEYSVDVSTGIRATNGASLQQASKKTVTAREMAPVVSFESEGMVMVPGHTESLPVTAINVPEADLNLYRVKDDKIAQFFEEYRYYGARYLEEYLEHRYTARIKTGAAANARNRVLVDLNKLGKIKEPGIYFATLGKPGAFEFDAKTWFTLSSIGLQLRKFQDHTQVIAQDISTGRLLSNVNIAVMDRDSKVWLEGNTDNKGGWSFNPALIDKEPGLILARKNNEITTLRYQAPVFDLSDFDVGGRPSQPEELFTWSPRDIYRPGEEVTLSILKRDQDGQPVPGPVKIEITKPDGSTLNRWLVESEAGGYHEVSFNIPSGAPVGLWRASIFSPGNEKARTRFNFKVEEFLPERLRLSFNPDTDTSSTQLTSIISATGLNVNVYGEYLYGAPAAGNRLDTSIRVRAWGSPFTQLKGYIFGNPEKTAFDTEELGSLTLDDKGRTVTKLPENISLNHWQVPADISLQYSLYETGGRAINRFYHVLLWPRETFIGVKPLFSNDRADSHAKAAFTLLKANHKGDIQTTGDARIQLYREEEKYFWSYTRTRGWHYQRVSNEYLALTQDVHISSQQPIPVELPVEWGRYRLEVTDLQSGGKTTYSFFAGEDWYAAWNASKDHIRPEQVNLALNQKAYKAGDKVTVRITSPTEGTAVVMLEADKVLHTTEVELKNKTADVEILLPADLKQHNIYISAFVVAPTKNTEKVAKRSFGIIPLPLDRDNRKLNITIDAPESWRPGQQVVAKINVLGSDQQPVTGNSWVTLNAVDSGALSVTGYKIENPYDYFYSQRKYNVRISDMFDNVLEYKLADNAKLRWGGDADLTRGGDKPRTEVNIVSLFSGLVNVSNGQASIPLNLPQFEGELQLTAVGFTGDQFGLDSQSVKIASPIVSQLSSPRFLASGDKASLAIDLVNMSGKTQNVTIAIDVSNPLVLDTQSKANSASPPTQGPSKSTFLMQPGQKEIINFNVKALEPAGQGTIKAKIGFGDDILEREWSIGVRDAYPALYEEGKAVLAPGETLPFNPGLLAGLKPTTIKGELRISNLPDLKTVEHWRYLTDYPYTCLEQTTSKSFPYAVPEFSNAKSLSVIEIDNKKIQKRVQSALARLRELQQASGGFGLWSRKASEEHWLTAYTTEFLLDINKAGSSVPDNLIDPAIKRLKHYVSQRSPLAVNRWSQSPSHYQVAYKAYAAYILAREGKITLGPLRDIAEKELADSQSALPGVHLGLAMIHAGSQKEGEKLIADALEITRKDSVYLGDYGSLIRDQALVINYLLQSGVLKDQALKQLISLNTRLKQKKYLSPQERSALFRLAVTVEGMAKDDQWNGELIIAKQKLQLQHTGKLIMSLTRTDLNKQISFVNNATTPLFATFAVTGIPLTQKTNINNGIKVRTNHYLIKKGVATEVSDLKSLKTGDMILTRVKVTASRRVPDALLVSLLPAGLELENQHLDNALKLEDVLINSEPVSQHATFEYQEFRDDRYVAALDLYKNSEQILFYISRAVNPGEYLIPPAMVESMYTPETHGIGNSSGRIKVVK